MNRRNFIQATLALLGLRPRFGQERAKLSPPRRTLESIYLDNGQCIRYYVVDGATWQVKFHRDFAKLLDRPRTIELKGR